MSPKSAAHSLVSISGWFVFVFVGRVFLALPALASSMRAFDTVRTAPSLKIQRAASSRAYIRAARASDTVLDWEVRWFQRLT